MGYQIPGLEEIDYANAHGIPVPVTKERPYSMDANIWHLSHEGGDLAGSLDRAQRTICFSSAKLRKRPRMCPPISKLILSRERPLLSTAKSWGLWKPVEKLNAYGAANGIGVADMVENRLVGMKSRGVYETPGGTILFYAAHAALESITLDRQTMHYKEWRCLQICRAGL